MGWTKDVPKRPGYYWWRAERSSGPCIFRVDQSHIDRNDLIKLGRAILYLDEMPGEWSSHPLTPPEEAT